MVAEIIAGCEDPHGTCVETYLQRRGITAAPLPPSIRYLANAYGQYGALVALATDAAGEVHGLQLIYLTEDGRKAPLKVQKRTNKAHNRWSDVAAERLPGRAPIIICCHLLSHVADHRRALVELMRVLSPQGLLLVSYPSPHRSPHFQAAATAVKTAAFAAAVAKFLMSGARRWAGMFGMRS